MGTKLPTEIKAPARAIWCVWGIGVLFLLPAATFLFSWYRPYLPDVFLQPAMDIVLTLLGVVALPILIWLRASRVRRRRWLWTGLTLVGTVLGLLLPRGGLVCSGLPVFAYAVTGLTNRARQTYKRDTTISWVLVVLGVPLGFLVWWLAFNSAYVSDLRLGAPPFVTVQPTYEISLSSDLSRPLSGEQFDPLLHACLKIMLLRLKEYSPGVVSTTVGNDTISIGLFRIRNPEETVALVSNPGLLELVDIGESPLPVGTTLPIPHRTIVSGRYLRTTRDTGGQWISGGAGIGFDQGGYAVLRLEFDTDGAKMLRDFTSANIGKYMALTMDNVIIVSPVINAPILEGQLVVSGISLEQARLIVLELKYGALPMRFTEVGANPVTPAH